MRSYFGAAGYQGLNGYKLLAAALIRQAQADGDSAFFETQLAEVCVMILFNNSVMPETREFLPKGKR